MKAKQTNKDQIYVYSSFNQFCLPVLEFLVQKLYTARYWNRLLQLNSFIETAY